MQLLWKNLLFTLVIPGTVGVYLPFSLSRGEDLASGSGLVPALALFAAGSAVYSWCVWDFATFGRGTPAPIDAPKNLVVRGLYRYTRNPMYLGVLAVISGWTTMFPSVGLVAYGLGVAAMFHLFVVLYEERQLQKLFGEEYERYRGRVPRWLPRVRRSDS